MLQRVVHRSLLGRQGLIGAGILLVILAIAVYGVALPDGAGAGRTDWTGVRGKRIAIVPQGAMTGLSPVHKIGAQLTEMITLHGGVSTPAELLDRVGLDGLDGGMLRSYPHELSGGQRQRVAIALTSPADRTCWSRTRSCS